MKQMLMLAVVGVGGYLAYRHFTGPQTGSTSVSPYSNPSSSGSASLMTQPSQIYPVAPVSAPRVDNSSQPWYAGNRQGFDIGSPDSIFGGDFANIVADFKGVSSIADSAKSIWDDLGMSDWFSGSAGDTFETQSYDDSWMNDFSFTA